MSAACRWACPGAWIATLEAASDACYLEGRGEHFDPLLGYQPHTQSIEACNAGGRRHFLDGRPVHAGMTLELLLPAGQWLRGRYEWSYAAGEAPTFHVMLGGPAEAPAPGRSAQRPVSAAATGGAALARPGRWLLMRSLGLGWPAPPPAIAELRASSESRKFRSRSPSFAARRPAPVSGAQLAVVDVVDRAQLEGRDVNGWSLHVLGKGGRRRTVAVPASVRRAVVALHRLIELPSAGAGAGADRASPARRSRAAARADLGQFLVEQLTEDRFVRAAPFVTRG